VDAGRLDMSGIDPRQLAVDYLLAVRHDPARGAEAELELAGIRRDQLAAALADDAARQAFWIDVYNAAVLRNQGPDIADAVVRWRHFRRTVITVAGQPLSLDDIEHGILRRSSWKVGLGYLRHPLPSRFERVHRVRRVDPRIHFALNCGAAACPPIAAYRAEHIDEQLELATRSYLASEVRHEGQTLLVPAVLLWFAGDFGGAPGMRRFLHRYGVAGWNRPIRFRAYDWTAVPGRWSDTQGWSPTTTSPPGDTRERRLAGPADG
jgi:hypothetical protein